MEKRKAVSTMAGWNSDILDEEILRYCEENQISGMLRVTVRDRIVYQRSIGYADRENRISFHEDSMFTLYSLSKPFCAIGLMLLKDRGLLDIDAHPSVYIPEAKGFDERVTIRHMLHHISGLPDFEQNEEFARAHAPGYGRFMREHIRDLVRYPQYFTPGTGYRYANVNMVLCALIIENLTGLSYEAYMNQYVLAPLGMKTAVVDNEDRVIPARVQGYEWRDGAVKRVEKSHNWLLGAGDLVGTVDDVYALNGAIKHRRLLTEQSWEEVLTPSPVSSMGMGCNIAQWHGKMRIRHNGGHTGFRTLHVQIPDDDFDIIFLSNSGYGSAREDIMELIYSAFYVPSADGGDALKMDEGYI